MAEQDFTNFPPVPDGHTRVFLNRSFGEQRGPLYGPGWAHVPDRLLKALEASPDLVRTDSTGRALSDSTVASVNGPRADIAGDAAIPHPERTDDDDAEIIDDEPIDSLSAHRAVLAEAAESGERTGGQTIGETGSHLDTSRTLTAQPGQLTPDSGQVARAESERQADARTAGGTTAARTGATSTQPEAPRPATKTALRETPVEELRAIAERKGVVLKEDATKDEIVDELYNARVSLD